MRKYLLALMILIVLAIIVLRKNKKENFYKIEGIAQGTTYSVIYGVTGKVDLSDSIQSILEDFDLTFSSYIPHSVISRINNNDKNVTTNPRFDYIFNLSKEINLLTGGAFDITVAPLVNAWGFGWKEINLPARDKIDSLLQLIGMDKVKIENCKVLKTDERVQLDVNAIAQGYSVDVIAEFLDKKGIQNYLINVGGEVKAGGTKQNGQAWRVGIERPTENNDSINIPVEAIVELQDMSLATSGNYKKYYEKDGLKYVHTIDPKTGMTIQSNLLSTTVLARECARADALATGFMVLGLEKSIELAKTLNNVDVFFIYTDSTGVYKEWLTPGFKLVTTIME